jgi:DNA polymerase-3 subunit delta'
VAWGKKVSAGPLLNQERALALLERTLSSGELPPAYLFVGPHGVGKEEAALALAQSLNCQSGAGEEGPDLFEAAGSSSPEPHSGIRALGGCGICSACGRIGRYSHPDVIVRMPLPRPRGGKKGDPADPTDVLAFKADNPYRDPEISTGSLSIGIADVREIIPQLAYAPVEGGKRVVIFRESERMTEEAQNALLKSMEEPPPHTIFILTTHRPNALLPTVRSRSRIVHFRPLKAEEISYYLREHGIASGDEMNVAQLARGSLKRAICIAEGGVPGREEAIRLLSWAVEGRNREALAWAAVYTFKTSGVMLTEARSVLEELLSLARDVAVVQSGGKVALMNPDRADMLRDVGRRAPDGAGLQALEAVADACGEVDSNVNLALIYATLFDALIPLGIH